MFDARSLALLKDGAALVDTACGSLVTAAALTAHLVTGRLNAVLDIARTRRTPPPNPTRTGSGPVRPPHHRRNSCSCVPSRGLRQPGGRGRPCTGTHRPAPAAEGPHSAT
ncbi:NAD(P)-dependent oxidoreductase [Streptomyces monashensis]|uniref:D-isomer specific 2-hydroxyacid dehydrogenase NAD-binding domain-containing protein n=1 Tax=Streptomyces monashensis TaxID=1678012 RepID=A0A1S2QES4_9ACTN|nr:NAD(P)-dependent oxidoreductase [Streptomyces monashensis]OIK04101.1 hypothetical protein BIV23_18075 [Streptomyces monashensis]